MMIVITDLVSNSAACDSAKRIAFALNIEEFASADLLEFAASIVLSRPTSP